MEFLRIAPTIGPLHLPNRQKRAWVLCMARYPTRVPTGIFRYASMEQANADWERWHAETVLAKLVFSVVLYLVVHRIDRTE